MHAVIPAIDLEAVARGLVYWPGAAAGIGAPDRPPGPHRRAVRGARRAAHPSRRLRRRPCRHARRTSTRSGAIAARVAVPLQLAGGVDSAEAIRLAFAAGRDAGRADDGHRRPAGRPAGLPRGRRRLAGGRPGPAPGATGRVPVATARIRRRRVEALVGELVGAGVAPVRPDPRRRPTPDLDADPSELVRSYDAEILVAGGVRDLDGLAPPARHRRRRRHPRGGPPLRGHRLPDSPGGRRMTTPSTDRADRAPLSALPLDRRRWPRSIAACWSRGDRLVAGRGCRGPRPGGRRRRRRRLPDEPASPAAGRRDPDRHASTPTRAPIVIKIEADLSPIAAGNFVALASCGFYDGTAVPPRRPGASSSRAATRPDRRPAARLHHPGRAGDGDLRPRHGRHGRGPRARTRSARSSSSSSTTRPPTPSPRTTRTRSSGRSRPGWRRSTRSPRAADAENPTRPAS